MTLLFLPSTSSLMIVLHVQMSSTGRFIVEHVKWFQQLSWNSQLMYHHAGMHSNHYSQIFHFICMLAVGCHRFVASLYTVHKKTIRLTFDHNFGNCRPIYKILSLSDFCEILYVCIIKILHLTLNMFLHYLVKLDNYSSCRFQWHIAHLSSKFYCARHKTALIA